MTPRLGPRWTRASSSVLQETPRPRRGLAAILNQPATDYAVSALIVASVALLFAEHYFPVGSATFRVVDGLGDLITVLFGVELALRAAVARKRSRFLRRYWPDLLSLLSVFGTLRFLRLLRLLRLFQLGLILDRRLAGLRGVLRLNIYVLWALVVFTGIAVVAAGGLAYVFERGVSPGFETLESSLWWALDSIIAGEPVDGNPRTTPGRLILVSVMLSGMILFAIFTGVVSATMMERLHDRRDVGEMDIDELEGHIVICGWNQGLFSFLSEIALEPGLQGVPVLFVNELQALPDLSGTGFRPDHMYHLHGDQTQLGVLERAGIRRASRAVVVADTIHERPYKDRDARTVLATLTIERLNPEIFCVVELMDEANRPHLEFAGVEAILMRNEMSGLSLASACRHPDLMRVTRNLLTLRRGETMQRIAGPKARATFGELMQRLKNEENLILIGVETPGEGTTINPPCERLVEPSDFLFVIV